MQHHFQLETINMFSTQKTCLGGKMRDLSSQLTFYLNLSQNPKPLQLIYSTSSSWPFPKHTKNDNQQQIDIGVVDSSFNPPHKAHIALANSIKPDFEDEKDTGEGKYDSILLLFSVKNADKGMGTSKDATPIQRLEMMKLMANELEKQAGQSSKNVAVGIIEEPLMISKSTLIHKFIKEQNEVENTNKNLSFRLHWLVGFDTLERFFQVKYYPSPDYFQKACETFFQSERTTFVCARRGIESLPNKSTSTKADDDDQALEQDFLQSDLVKPWKECESIQMIDLPVEVQIVSSTAIRKSIRERGSIGEEELQEKLCKFTVPSIANYLLREGVYRT